MDWNQITLLLTASIRPNPGLKDNALHDPQRREVDYIDALRFNLSYFPQFRKVVLVDNSGWPLGKLQAAADASRSVGTEVEVIGYSGNDFSPALGKGWGEAELIRQSLLRSTLLQSTPMFAKMTGRHVLRNMAGLVERIGDTYEFACDLRDHGIYEALRMNRCGRHCDTRFFMADRVFYQTCFAGLHDSHRDGEFSLEGAYYRQVKTCMASSRVLCRFPIEPIYGGIAGHAAKNYDGLRERMKRSVRQSMRRFAPWLHI
jgi:hypothetical protein